MKLKREKLETDIHERGGTAGQFRKTDILTARPNISVWKHHESIFYTL